MATVPEKPKDQFLCSICVEVFSDPVTIPCGHNFCKNCISEQWKSKRCCKCPTCGEVFRKRPCLKVNTLFSEMVANFEQQGRIFCDICTETKVKALKSCVMCLASYCETHLKPHLTIPGLQRHQLIEPVENLEDRMCIKHGKLLELFCKTDGTCVCAICTVSDHEAHRIVPMGQEYEGQKEELKKEEAEMKTMIMKREMKIKELKKSVELSRKAADKESAEGVQVFNTVMEYVRRSLNGLIQEIEAEHKKTEKQIEDLIKELEEEILELQTKSNEMEQLSHSEDQQHFLQTFTALKLSPNMKKWTDVTVCPSHEGTVERAVTQLEGKISDEKKHLLYRKTVLKTISQFAVDVTLDPNTAHPKLSLSEDKKQVMEGYVKEDRPNNPWRFYDHMFVLGRQTFLSCRFYFEVQVKGKTEWALGVAYKSIKRKGSITLSPQNGYWVIWLKNANEYIAGAGPPVHLSLNSKPQTVGVFVDYMSGLVSFYDVDVAALIYSFTGCSFNDRLLPFFSPCSHKDGTNVAPLIITPVTQTREFFII